MIFRNVRATGKHFICLKKKQIKKRSKLSTNLQHEKLRQNILISPSLSFDGEANVSNAVKKVSIKNNHIHQNTLNKRNGYKRYLYP